MIVLLPCWPVSRFIAATRTDAGLVRKTDRELNLSDPLRNHENAQGSAEAGAFKNCFGDANAFVRREAFERVGGYTEDYGVGFEDWEVSTGTHGWLGHNPISPVSA